MEDWFKITFPFRGAWVCFVGSVYAIDSPGLIASGGMRIGVE